MERCMNNTRRQHKSIVLKGSPQVRVYRTFEDWQTEQQADQRTPEQRGIHVGSPVMWRYRANQVIVTERAIVAAIHEQTLTLQVKDVTTRTCNANVNEIVNNQFGRTAFTDTLRRPFIANQMETPQAEGAHYASEDSSAVSSWL
jgi:hypothetical protein